MKTLKIIDLVLQTLFLVYGIIYASISGNFISIYFFVGPVQVLGVLLHLFIESSWVQRQQRKLYGKTLVWIISLGIISFTLAFWGIPLLSVYTFVLLIINPFLAIWYFIIGTKELSSINKRELIHLK